MPSVRREPPPVAITMGEPAGIGGEIIIKSWLARAEHGLPPFFLLDDASRLSALAQSLGWSVPIVEIGEAAETVLQFDQALPVLAHPLNRKSVPGRPDPGNGPAVIGSIHRAVELCLDGQASALVTNPIQKESLYAAGMKHPGQTELIAEMSGGDTPVMMLACPELRTVPVTIHQRLAQAISDLTSDTILTTCRITLAALEQDFGIANPRLAVAGLNPHAGEGGYLGHEDAAIVLPAVEALQGQGARVQGPLPADTLFHPRARARYDAAICMYHDQALIPIKTIGFDLGVNITLGLPIVRTSPDHGTALDLAGTGNASPLSMIEAIRTAADIAASRAR